MTPLVAHPLGWSTPHSDQREAAGLRLEPPAEREWIRYRTLPLRLVALSEIPILLQLEDPSFQREALPARAAWLAQVAPVAPVERRVVTEAA